MSDQEIEAECAAALADAGIAPDRVQFYPLAAFRTEGGDVGAAYFRPHTNIEPDDKAFPDDAQRVVANLPENRDLHRIAVPAAPTDRATFAALVRHELEHAHHFDARVRIVACANFVYDVLQEVARDLDGCGGALTNSIPIEVDCNARASVYLTSRFTADEVQAIRDGPRSCLACSLIPPPPPETLPARMIAFAYIYRAAVEAHAQKLGHPVASILRTVHPQAPALWAALENGP